MNGAPVLYRRPFLLNWIKMITLDTRFRIELEKIIEEQIDALKDQLSVNAFTDVGQFRYLMGRIAALREMPDLLDIAMKKALQ
jgi:hypothetical protein